MQRGGVEGRFQKMLRRSGGASSLAGLGWNAAVEIAARNALSCMYVQCPHKHVNSDEMAVFEEIVN